jgi:hypothetical protein
LMYFGAVLIWVFNRFRVINLTGKQLSRVFVRHSCRLPS